MSNFCTPLLFSPFCLSEWVRIGQHPATPGRRNICYQPSIPHPFLNPITFGIFAAYWSYLVDVSIRYHARATHNYSLQITINSNLTQYSAKKLKQTHLTWNAKNKTKMLSKASQTPVWNIYSRTRYQSGTLIAKPDTFLEHCLDSSKTYTNYSSRYPISVDPLPLPPPVTIHFHLMYDHFYLTPPIYWMS